MPPWQEEQRPPAPAPSAPGGTGGCVSGTGHSPGSLPSAVQGELGPPKGELGSPRGELDPPKQSWDHPEVSWDHPEVSWTPQR